MSPVKVNLDSVEISELVCLSRVDLIFSLITGRAAIGRMRAMSEEATSSSGSKLLQKPRGSRRWLGSKTPNGQTINITPRVERPNAPAASLDLAAVADNRKLRPIPIMNVRNMVTPKRAALPRATPAKGVATAMPAVRGTNEYRR